jgi:ABC-2 type transport system permease protein
MRDKLFNKYRYSIVLLKELVITEFKLRYQGSVLGYLWSVMRPLFLFVIMYTVFVYFLKIGSDVPHWPVQLLLGIVLWNFFAEITNNGVRAIVDRGDVIRKINFPKYVIVLSSSISALINLLINLLVIAVFMAINQVPLQWTMLFAPLPIIELFVLAIGLAFLLSAWFVKVRDINYIWEIIMQGLFYASIVIYPITQILNHSQKMAELALLNPVAQIIQDTRFLLVTNDTDTLFTLSSSFFIASIPIAISVVVFIIGAAVFRKKSPYFAENV